MGVSFYAAAGLGVMVPADRLYVRGRVRGCSHPEPPSSVPPARYCPQCGRPVWVEERVPLAGYVPEGSSESDWEPTLCGLRVYRAAERDEVLVCRSLAVARGCGQGDRWRTMLEPEDEAEAREHLERVLAPLGLWDESRFGHWVVACVS